MKGIALIKGNEWEKARGCLEEALTIDPSLPVANYYLSLIRFMRKDFETALSDLKYEQDNNSRHTAPVLYQLARVLSSLQQDDEALACLEEALQLQPDNEVFQSEYSRLKAKQS